MHFMLSDIECCQWTSEVWPVISQLYTSPVRPSLIFTVSTVVATVAPYHRASNRNTCGAAPGEPVGRAESENKGSDIGAWRLHWGAAFTRPIVVRNTGMVPH